MDGSRFDALARTLAGRRTRRGLLAGLGGILVGAAGAQRADAACPDGQVSRRGLGCVCRATGRPPVGGDCPCPARQKRCAAGEACIPAELDCTPIACDGPNSCTACLPSSPDTCTTADAAGHVCRAYQHVGTCCHNGRLEASVFCCTPGLDCPFDEDGSGSVIDPSQCQLLTQAPCIRD
jgi:hypothetical protein